MDEMAERSGWIRLNSASAHFKAGGAAHHDWHSDFSTRFELKDGALTYICLRPSRSCRREPRRLDGKEKPGGRGAPGRFKRGIGVGASQHHPGHMGYREGEPGFEKLLNDKASGGPAFGIFSAELELTADGIVTMRNALPDSGTNHDTALAHVVAEILGFTSRDRVRVIW